MVNKENIKSVEKKYHGIDNSFVCYSVTLNNDIIVDVPPAEDNTDYQAIQEWAKIEGNNIIDPGA